jgi:uncharacterized membrane protein
MLKSIAPIWGRLKHMPTPALFRVHGQQGTDQDQPTFGQRLAEKVAAGVGSWTFLLIQSGFLLLWLIYNTLVFTRHFDSFPYILLNLLLSFQAAFTGPVLLIAANVGAMRDHKQSDRIEQLTKQNEDLAERLVGVEQMLDRHVSESLKAHTVELHDLGALMREVHGVVCAPSNGSHATSAKLSAEAAVPVAVAVAAPAAAPAAPEGSTPAPTRPRGRQAPQKAPRREK